MEKKKKTYFEKINLEEIINGSYKFSDDDVSVIKEKLNTIINNEACSFEERLSAAMFYNFMSDTHAEIKEKADVRKIKTKKFKQENSEIKEEVKKLEQKITELEQKITELKQENSEIKEKFEKLEQKIETKKFKQEKSKIKEKADVQKIETKKFKQEKSEIKEKADVQKIETKKFKQEKSKIKEKVEKLELQNQQLQNDFNVLPRILPQQNPELEDEFQRILGASGYIGVGTSEGQRYTFN